MEYTRASVMTKSRFQDVSNCSVGTPPLQLRARLLKLATYAATSTSAILIVAKMTAWFMTDSLVVLSSLVDSLLDFLTSLINLVAVHHAMQPDDLEHRFGHGKAEPLAGLGQSIFVASSVLFLCIQAIDNLLTPVPQKNITVGLSAMSFSLVLVTLLFTFQKYVVRRTQSVAINADSVHYLSDLLINSSVILALTITELTGWYPINSLLTFVVAFYVLLCTRENVKRSLNLLMDHELSEQSRQKIWEIVVTDIDVINMHDLRTRSSGTRDFIQLHLELDCNLPLWRAHEVTRRVQSKLRTVFPGADVLIHQDPTQECE